MFMIKTVYELFADTAKRASDRAFLCYPPTFGRGYHEDGLEVTYAEALGKIDALAARYREAGYQPGHRIALAAANLPEHFWHYLALNSIGATAATENLGSVGRVLLTKRSLANAAKKINTSIAVI